MRALAILILLIPLSGCITPTEPLVDTESCIEDMCVLIEPEPYWQEYKDRFGLKQVPFMQTGHSAWIDIGDGYVSWMMRRNYSSGPASNLYALDLKGQKIIPLDTTPQHHSTVSVAHGKQVLFAVEDKSLSGLDRFSLWIWSFENQTKWKLPINITGDKHPKDGFDGTWVVFSNTLRTYRAVELWAYNVHDGRLMQLFQPEPRNRHENGSYETVRTPVLYGGIAYYTVLWHHGDVSNSWTDIYATDLETNKTTHLYRAYGIQINEMDVNKDYLAYSNSEQGWLLNFSTGDVSPLPLKTNRKTWIPTMLDDDWIAYRTLDELKQDLWAYNPKTTQDIKLIEGSEDFGPGNAWLYKEQIYLYVRVINPYDDGPYFSSRIFTMDSPLT